MNRFQKIFDAQKALFASGITRTYEWRVEQLDRMARMIRENEKRFQEAMAKDFKTASQEYIFETAASAGESEVQKSQLKEWMKPVEAPIPTFLAKTGHKGMIYREPYGVALIIGPFNGPLLLLVRPALAALAILIFTFVWNDYFWAVVLTVSDTVKPVTAGLANLRGEWVSAWNLISAGTIVVAVPPVVMFFLMQRHFIAGLTMGAVKG